MWETLCWSGVHRRYSQSYPGFGLCQGLCWEGIALKAIQRQGAGYHSEEKRGSLCFLRLVYAYTRKIRTLSLDSCPIANSFSRLHRYLGENYDQLLRYQIITHPDLTQIFQVNEELANRIKDAVRSASSVEDLVEKVATKRYTKARPSYLTYILVGR